MSKKKKSKVPEKKKTPVLPVIIVLVVIAGALLLVFNPFEKKNMDSQTRSFLVMGGETRPVLDPEQFTGMTRDAYAAAKEIPQILDKIYCYCYCDDPPFNHKSLLSCFVEFHGAS